MIVVTGAAGFIGSCIVARLNEKGRADLILVDHWDGPEDPKKANLEGKQFLRYFDKKEFIQLVELNKLDLPVECIIHMGACSSTVLQDAQYFEENNFQYSRKLAEWAVPRGVRFIYASSAATYGDGTGGYHDDDASTRNCRPLNLYGESKQKFDVWLLDHSWIEKAVGLKFFNVFGPNEYHKADMRSVIAKSYEGVTQKGKMALFKSYRKEYADGEQKRDFIYVKDAVDIVLYFMENIHLNGIFNVGTGKARSWNDVAKALFAALGKPPVIEYVEMPEILKPRYQYFTQADMSKLRDVGYVKEFTGLEEAVRDYAVYLENHKFW